MPRRRSRRGRDLLIESAEFMGWALGGIEREIAETRTRLSKLVDQAGKLRTKLGRSPGRPTIASLATATKKAVAARRGGISAEGRKRISEMMKKRWAERKKKGKRSLAG